MGLRQRIAHFFFENQIMVVLVALILGVLFPDFFRPIAPFGTPLLMLIFFTSSLRLSGKEILRYAKDWKMLILATLFMLVFMPVAMWFPPSLFAPEWAIPFLIVGAMPTGMTIALIAEYFGGKASLALVITATTSLLAPFTIPIIFKLLLGQSVPIPALKLFGDLILTIVLPFAAAMLVQRTSKKFVKKQETLWKEISIIAFGLLIAGIVADSAPGAALTFSARDIGILVVMLVYLGGLTWLAFAMAWWRTSSERATIGLCMVYMNNTLALFIGNRYFSGDTIPRLVLILIAVNALLPFLKWMAAAAAGKEASRKLRVRSSMSV